MLGIDFDSRSSRLVQMFDGVQVEIDSAAEAVVGNVFEELNVFLGQRVFSGASKNDLQSWRNQSRANVETRRPTCL